MLASQRRPLLPVSLDFDGRAEQESKLDALEESRRIWRYAGKACLLRAQRRRCRRISGESRRVRRCVGTHSPVCLVSCARDRSRHDANQNTSLHHRCVRSLRDRLISLRASPGHSDVFHVRALDTERSGGPCHRVEYHVVMRITRHGAATTSS